MERSHTWDGTLSLDEFHASARVFSERWKAMNPAFPPWMWIPSPRLPWGVSKKSEGYLCLEGIHNLKCNEDHCSKGSYSAEEEVFDAATLAEHYDPETHVYDFHILYSASYRVPLLYFRGYQCDGQPMVLEDIENDLPLCSSKILKESKWTFMTQEDHPYLNRPWFTLHPCGTSDLMKMLFSGATRANRDLVIQQYLLSWLSFAGQPVALKFPLELLHRSIQ